MSISPDWTRILKGLIDNANNQVENLQYYRANAEAEGKNALVSKFNSMIRQNKDNAVYLQQYVFNQGSYYFKISEIAGYDGLTDGISHPGVASTVSKAIVFYKTKKHLRIGQFYDVEIMIYDTVMMDSEPVLKIGVKNGQRYSLD